jgi:predicted amidophosphoribosyltransferase
LIKNKWIILIDDVYTSGATMQEAARILKKSGAKKVIGLVLARG